MRDVYPLTTDSVQTTWEPGPTFFVAVSTQRKADSPWGELPCFGPRHQDEDEAEACAEKMRRDELPIVMVWWGEGITLRGPTARYAGVRYDP